MLISLSQAGYDVVVIDNLSNSFFSSIEMVRHITGKPILFCKGDIRDKKFLEKIFDQYKIDSVVHFAGLKSVSESIEKPLDYYNNNINGTLNLLTTMVRFDCKNFIFSSSATVYGIPEKLPLKESSPVSATNPYGESKLFIEKVLRDLKISDDTWNIIILRYFNPVGAHSSGLLGEMPNKKPNNLFPIISRVASGEINSFSIFGSDFPTKDGTGVRDYIHIEDLTLGHLKALEIIDDLSKLITVNLGTGVGYSVLEILRKFEEISGHSIPFNFADRRPGDVASCYSDVSYAKKILGWKAVHNLSQMCEDQWRWQIKNLNREV